MKTLFPVDNKEVVLLEGAFTTSGDGQALRAMLYFWKHNLPMTEFQKHFVDSCKQYATAINENDVKSLEEQERAEWFVLDCINDLLSVFEYKIGWYAGSLCLAQSRAPICKHFITEPTE